MTSISASPLRKETSSNVECQTLISICFTLFTHTRHAHTRAHAHTHTRTHRIKQLNAPCFGLRRCDDIVPTRPHPSPPFFFSFYFRYMTPFEMLTQNFRVCVYVCVVCCVCVCVCVCGVCGVCGVCVCKHKTGRSDPRHNSKVGVRRIDTCKLPNLCFPFLFHVSIFQLLSLLSACMLCSVCMCCLHVCFAESCL